MDEEVLPPNPPQTKRGCVMRTRHDGETLAAALDFLLHSPQPDAACAPEGCNGALIFTVSAEV